MKIGDKAGMRERLKGEKGCVGGGAGNGRGGDGEKP